jgi:thiamine-phosphate pyrophosphorylase
VLGLEGYRHIVKQMREADIQLPIVAIGGITAEDIPAIMQTGVTGIALSGTILHAEKPIEEMKRIINITQP